MPAKVIFVEANSPAERGGIMPGDILVKVDSKEPQDILDYQLMTSKPSFDFTLRRGGEMILVSLNKAEEEPVGLTFESSVFDSLKTCNNRCLFCFIDQLPKGVRKSLLLKDDDFRHSFLYGNFITLTNLKEKDIDRIIEQRLSPLYVSIHSLNTKVRKALIRPKGEDLAVFHLKRLTTAKIELHIQIVLCPQINDEGELKETIKGLRSLGSVASIGIVPVGLTGHREGLEPLRPVEKKEASKLINQVFMWQEEELKTIGKRRIYLADEFYLLAQRDLPSFEEYEDFDQLENGIGLARLFLNSLKEELFEEKPDLKGVKAAILTAELAYPVMAEAARILSKRGVLLEVLAVKNTFFGGGVNVTGLLTGWDIIEALEKTKGEGPFLLPDIVINPNGLLLDDMTLEELKERSRREIVLVSHTAEGFIDDLKKLKSGR